VYAGRSDETVRADRQEILSWRWIEPRALTAEMSGAILQISRPGLDWSGDVSGAITRGAARSAIGVTDLSIPLLQAYKVGRYIAGRKIRGIKRYPLV